MVKVILKRGKEESLGRFHTWIFSGAIERIDGQVGQGEVVDVVDSKGKFLARGHFQLGSIAVRVLSFTESIIDEQWWQERLRNCVELRVGMGFVDSPSTTCYRLVHGEGDWLPGLVVDIYGSVAVIQAHSVGMHLSLSSIVGSLREIYGSRLTAIYNKSSQTVPFMADFGVEDGFLWHRDGITPPAEDIVLEGGHKFIVNWVSGQKSGFFIDQRQSRALVESYAKGRDVLNTFCYTGGFSVYALAAGATNVDSIDSSKVAIELTRRNVELNFGTSAPHRAIVADAMEYVRGIGKDQYDMIILDPPAFAKHRKAIAQASQAYRRLNAEAISRVRSGGIVFTFSCSQAISSELFRTTIFSAAAITGRRVRILHQLTQPCDHPVSIYHPEGEYLKGLVLEVE